MALLRNLVIVAYLSVLAALVLRTHLRADDRWGFSMFRDVQMVQVRYEWEDAQGRTWAADPTPWLRGEARLMLPRKRPLDWIVGLGAYTDQAHTIARFLVTEHPDEGAVACRAVVKSRAFDEGPWVDTVLRWPPE